MALRHSLKEARSFFPLQAGFTIVELLIVVVVIAILAALVIVSYNGIQQRAHDASAQTSARQAATKILAYATEHSDMYPDSLAAIAIADSDQISYHYTVDNAAVPKTFCIEAKVTNHTYYVSHEVT